MFSILIGIYLTTKSYQYRVTDRSVSYRPQYVRYARDEFSMVKNKRHTDGNLFLLFLK